MLEPLLVKCGNILGDHVNVIYWNELRLLSSQSLKVRKFMYS